MNETSIFKLYLPVLSKLGFHFAMKGLSRCWSKQYFEWSHDVDASLKKVKDEDGQRERLKPELRPVKSEFRCWRWWLVLLRKAENPDPCGKLWRGRNSEMLASWRHLRFFWRETSRHSPNMEWSLSTLQELERKNGICINEYVICRFHRCICHSHPFLRCLQDQVPKQMPGQFLMGREWTQVGHIKISSL